MWSSGTVEYAGSVYFLASWCTVDNFDVGDYDFFLSVCSITHKIPVQY